MLHEVAQTTAAPDRPEITPQEAKALARATVNLAARWELSDAEAGQILGGLSPRTWARWKVGQIGRIDRDLATRMSLLMGIHKALRYIFTDPARGYAWVRKPSAAFAGASALEVMMRGSVLDLAQLRAYLDRERGAW